VRILTGKNVGPGPSNEDGCAGRTGAFIFRGSQKARRASYQANCHEKRNGQHIVSARKSAATRIISARVRARSITEIDFIAVSGRVHASKLIFLIAREGRLTVAERRSEISFRSLY